MKGLEVHNTTDMGKQQFNTILLWLIPTLPLPFSFSSFGLSQCGPGGEVASVWLQEWGASWGGLGSSPVRRHHLGEPVSRGVFRSPSSAPHKKSQKEALPGSSLAWPSSLTCHGQGSFPEAEKAQGWGFWGNWMILSWMAELGRT